MRAATLNQLGRRLSGLARDLTHVHADKAATPGELAILDDLLVNGRSAVRDITDRTGFAQSHVSASLAKLTERGQVKWEKNPKDARSRWADLTQKERAQLEAAAATRVEDALAAAPSADVVVVVQNHREYDIDAIARASKRFLDTKGKVTAQGAQRL